MKFMDDDDDDDDDDDQYLVGKIHGTGKFREDCTDVTITLVQCILRPSAFSSLGLTLWN